jgi:hypothetical protein
VDGARPVARGVGVLWDEPRAQRRRVRGGHARLPHAAPERGLRGRGRRLRLPDGRARSPAPQRRHHPSSPPAAGRARGSGGATWSCPSTRACSTRRGATSSPPTTCSRAACTPASAPSTRTRRGPSASRRWCFREAA